LLAALVITSALDYVGAMQGWSIYWQQTPYSMINGRVHYNTGWLTLLGNLSFLMDSYVPTWGSDLPLWSLFYEWWFYMLYPLFWLVTKRSIFLATCLVMALFGLSYLPSVWPFEFLRQVLASMPAWWFGTLLAEVYVRRIKISFTCLMEASR
jgi:peptidoglycan/LPS O-acetylase OafA/YrhL